MRRSSGEETTQRLKDWTDSRKAAERLAGNLLAATGYTAIDPTHPLGGPDGLKDLVCVKDGKSWVAGVYFPNGQKTFATTLKKFKHDLPGAAKRGATGFVFVTNQYLRDSEREKLKAAAGSIDTDILHLEGIALVLNRPQNYGTRLDFLHIDMTKEEQLAFFAYVAELTSGIQSKLGDLFQLLSAQNLAGQIPTEDLDRFRDAIYSLVGYPGALAMFSPVDRLRPPTGELDSYATQLFRLVGHPHSMIFNSPVDRLRPPLRDLQEYESRLSRLVGPIDGIVISGPVARLRPPLDALREYEATLERILTKLRTLADFQPPAV